MLLRAVNLSIAFLLAAFLAACFWYGYRPLPEVSGQVFAPVSASATITRDALGVPHIKAASWEDAIFLQGYAMAQDRLWQMDAMRRQAAGELSEVIGPGTLPADQDARRLGLGRIAQERERTLTPQERALFTAFARGINYFIETHRGRLPLEFALLGYDPRPWRVRDSLLAGLEMYSTLTTNWRQEVMKQQMVRRGDRAKVDFLFPLGASEPQPGSNAWVISGAHTASGKPILANDPHLEFALPSPWYLIHLEAPDLDVTGAAIVGLPAVIIGHNKNIAWGVTNLQFDVQDLYHEQFDPRTGRYRFENGIEQARLDQDVIAVKGAQPIRITTWITRHGPMFLTDNGQQYTLRWTPADPGGFAFPFLEIDRAQNWGDFRNALTTYVGPAQNFVYADRAGNIGYQVAGRLPVRKNCVGDIPSEGATGECEWDGFIPFDALPQTYNPASGTIVSANQNPFPEKFGYKINGNFAPLYRARQIEARLASRSQWKAEEMLGVQTDVYSGYEHFLAKEIVAAFDRQKPTHAGLAEAVTVLRNWNGQMERKQAAPLVATLVFLQLRTLIGDRAAGGLGEVYQSATAPQVIEKMLREKPDGWFPDYDQLLLRALTGAVEAGMKLQGSKISRWDWGTYQPLTLAHPVAGRLPLVGRYFNIGPVPMRGSPTAVVQYTGRLGPSLRMIVDLGDLEHSFANIATGESGQRFSTHYKDQWDAYYNGKSFPMQFEKVDAKHILTVSPLKN